MERLSALLRPGVNKLDNGISAEVKLERPYENVEPGDTSWHEAGHAVLMVLRGRFLRLASRIPNIAKGYLGRTEGEVDAVSAMGPDALGHSGTGWDRKIASWLGDMGTAASVAKQTIYSNWAAFRALARGIEAEGEVSGFRANQLIEEDKNPPARVLLNGPFGERSFVASTREANGHIVPLDIPKAA
jgi:hypothetical protein